MFDHPNTNCIYPLQYRFLQAYKEIYVHVRTFAFPQNKFRHRNKNNNNNNNNNVLGSKGRQVRRADNFISICEPIF
jgi:hypothetical protein